MSPALWVNLGLAVASLIWAIVAPGTGAAILAATCAGFALGRIGVERRLNQNQGAA